MRQKILILGAGASGLAAAYKLCDSKYDITILEARSRAGGRIYSFEDNFDGYVEGGAEFIHGKLPTTLSFLKYFSIDYQKTSGKWYRVKCGMVEKTDSFIEHYSLLEKHLKALKEDLSVNDFLNLHFPGDEYTDFKQSVRSFVEGYDAADTSKASALNFKETWLKDDDSQQYRIEGGYCKLTDALSGYLSRQGVEIHLDTIVKEIRWSNGNVAVKTEDNKIFIADKIIITLPPPLVADKKLKAGLEFIPPLVLHTDASGKIGYGSVIKILIDFKDTFWENPDFSNAGWILSDEIIPTWWTQQPKETKLLTGWVAGSQAEKISQKSDSEILDLCYESLGNIFKLSSDYLSSITQATKVLNWKTDPFSAGAYSYVTINRLKQIHILNEPVANVIYFAGEALETENTGTVEAALVSGMKVADKIISELKVIS